MAAIEVNHDGGGAAEIGNANADNIKEKFCPVEAALRQPKFSNPNISLLSANNISSGDLLCEIPNILTREEGESLVYSLDKGLLGKEWTLEGFDRQHRVQRYQLANVDGEPVCNNSFRDDESSNGENFMEESFGWIFDRVRSSVNQGTNSHILNHRPYEVVVTEHTPSSYRSVVDVFEQFQLCPCRQSNKPCSCYLAHVTLVNKAIQHVEKPQTRDLECWDVTAPTESHSGEMTMEANGAVVKMGESLWNWRCRISDVEEKINSEESSVVPTEDTCSSSDGNGDALASEMDKLKVLDKKEKKKSWTRTKKLKALNKRSITITFRGIHPSPKSSKVFVADPELLAKQQQLASLPLSELLTIIVTTSPIRSNPSTEMLEHTFDTFQFAGEEFAFECHKVIVCDGCRIVEENDNVSDINGQPKIRVYANGKQNLRNGVATVDQSKNYQKFKAALHQICEEANTPSTTTRSPFLNTKVVELDERHGYGFALRHALRHCVNTPYVCVIQHDRNFMKTTPIKEVVNAIICDPMQQIKYVGMNMRSNIMYFDIFSGKYGKRAIDEFKTLILRPKELCLGDNMYGPNGEQSMPDPWKKNRSQNLETLRETYRRSNQNMNQMEWVQSIQNKDNQLKDCQQLSLTPTLFWYDNTHVVETAHYRDFIFNPKYKMVARGGFVEDKLSPVITRNVERLGLKDGHAKFGCYILDDHSGVPFTGHLDGGSYNTSHLHLERKNNVDTA